MNTILLLLITTLPIMYNWVANKSEANLEPTSVYFQEIQNEGLNLVVMKNESGKWGYQITRDSKLLISQFQIPAVAGERYFQDSIDARKVGELVIKRIKESNTFPSITLDDLHKLQIKV